MSTSTSRAELGIPLMMRMPEGASLRVFGVDVALIERDGAFYECRLTLEAPPEVYLSFAVRGIFHLAPDNRGHGAESFAPRGPVRIEARLDPELRAEVELAGGTAESVAAIIRSASQAGKWSPFLQTEAWYALHVTCLVEQDVDSDGELRVGYSTVFASMEPGLPTAPGPLRLPLLTVVSQVLDERNIEWSETADDEVIEAEVRGESGSWTCFFIGRETENRVSVYSQAAWYAPEHVRPQMAELLTRINYGLSNGNFEMDFSDGELRFKTSLDVTGAEPSAALIDNLLSPNFAAMDTYLPALEAVRDGRLSPQEALEAAESRPH